MRIDFILAGIAAGLAAAYLAGTSFIPRLMIGDPLGPRAFPILIGIGLLGASLLLLVETLKSVRAGEAETLALPPVNRRLLAVMIGIVLMLWSFEPIGYLLSVGGFLLAMTMILNRGHWLANVLVSVGFTVISAYVFNHLLDVRLPAGLLAI